MPEDNSFLYTIQVLAGIRLAEVPGREIASVVDRPGLRTIRDR